MEGRLAEQYRKWYCSAMSYYDRILDFAMDNHYLVSTDDARELGVPPAELPKLAARGRLENLSRGLYRVSRYVPSDSDAYAVAVARAGGDAYLYGESVLALLGLAPTNLSRIFVASPRRVRRRMPETVRVVFAPGASASGSYDGIPSQTVAEALRSCQGSMMPDRLAAAARRARDLGYLTARQMREMEGFEHGRS